MSPTPPSEKSERRNKLIGRAFVIGLLLLIAVYLAPMFLRLMG
jgi:hypothetical protein